MTSQGMARPPADDLRGFGVEARRAFALAETEARGLRHERVGTEHVLIGLLAVEACPAAVRLRDAGATITAARHKVVEAVPQGDPRNMEVLPRSERAQRAIGRARRFSHAARSATVGTDHLLLGVLDVEGTAGQVLRGLGVEVEALRAALRAGAEPPDEGDPDAGDAGGAAEGGASGPMPLTCPACAYDLEDGLTYRVVIASGPRGPREAVAYTCGDCGRVLGIAPS
jgi:ATP-dependent Clp protease ATP-binding subunit ClpC